MKKTLLQLGIAVMAIIGLASCDGDNAEGNARLVVRLTDAPADYDKVMIDVQGVSYNVSNDTEGENGWALMNNSAIGVVDMLELTGGIDTLLADQELAPGYISQIRLHLGEKNTLVMGEEEVALSTPSAQQSGLKLNLHTELLAGVTYNVLLDFDVAKSIVASGNEKYSLKPVIRAVAEATSGAVMGTVEPVGAGAVAYIYEEGEDGMPVEVASAFTDENGQFLLKGIAPGEYTVSVEVAEGFEMTTEAQAVTVELGAVANVGTFTAVAVDAAN
ncbi:DUF4382 domain-containing protein [Limibacter armeniacum]|uniref:DUF4382 domain-containing protein n=1 Tax=Limibacter armeniacum TaxID=466084 RepID=UPI002FE5727E